MKHLRIPLFLALCAASSSLTAQTPPASALAADIAGMQRELGQLRERVNRLEAQQQGQGIIQLLNQVEALRTEVAALRGSQQEMAHMQQNADRRQKELFANFDDRLRESDQRLREFDQRMRELDQRLRELASRPAPAAETIRLQPSASLMVPQPTAAGAVDPEAEGRRYDAALALFRAGDYRAAVTAFQEFLRQYPSGALASNGHYWLGLSHFALGEFREAAASQLRLLKDFPLSAKVPDAMVNLARAQIQMGDIETARTTLEQVIARYPVSRAAEVARQVQALIR